MNMFLTILFAIIAVVAIIYIFLIWNFDYWKNFGVKSPKAIPFVGNYPSVATQKRHMTYDLQDIYEKYKHTDNFVGIFSCRTPQLLITNAELVRRILGIDFKYFHDNELSRMIEEKSDFILAHNPFTLTGEKWKEIRAEVTPGLTISRVKTVFPVTNSVCQRMTEYISQQIKIGSKEGVEAKDLSLRFTSEVVTDCVLGLKARSFSEKPTPILGMITKLFEQSIVLIFFTILFGLFPFIVKLVKIRFVPKDTEKFFVNLMQNAIDLRKSVNEDRTDFMNYMLQLQEKKKLSTRELTAHTMTFLFDGFETTAGVLSHSLLLLGRDLERQQRLRMEILDRVGHNYDFETIMDLPYLDACIHETIRIFPPAFSANKICTESVQLTNKDGSSFVLPKGSVVVLPFHPIMNDADYYTNPEHFQPERFLQENGGLKKYKDMGAYYGFGDGPRTCLGMRFAMAQLKGALVEILRHYEVRVNPKTRKDNILDPTYFLTRLDGGIWLNFNKFE